ncbi:hypothetical protein As57867_022671, partial [Aphanomyces stellatus]
MKKRGFQLHAFHDKANQMTDRSFQGPSVGAAISEFTNPEMAEVNIQVDSTTDHPYKSAPASGVYPCTLSWENINYTVHGSTKDEKHILHNVTGRSAPGQLTAIMGPSGSGKTTLLDILADRVSSGAIAGDIHVNGRPRDSHFRLLASYVAQEDSLLGSFTV